MSIQLIPQHQLKNSTGQLVDFDLLVWNEKGQDYDVEKPHRHDFNEVLIFYKGGGTHDIDFTTFEARTHAIHFVASHNVHLVLRGAASQGCSLLFSTNFLDKEFINDLPFNTNVPVLELNAADFSQIDLILEQIKKEFANKEAGYEAIIRAHLQVFMLNLKRVYNKQRPDSLNKALKPEVVSRFLTLVQNEYLNHVTVEGYAEKLYVSAKHLIELCKTHTGKTPLKHINELTVSEAKKLLFHTQLSVKEIAHQLNFDDPTNFSKYFKNATGYTPSEYREGIR